MAIVKVLARDWLLEIDTDPLSATPTGTPVWTEVKGLNTFTFSNEKNDADTTSFDSGGWLEHLPASRGRSMTGEGFYYEDPATGDRDPGQEAVEAYNDKIGPDGLASFRLTSPGGNIKTFKASVNLGDVGGGNDDATSWGFELTVSGQVTSQ